MLFTSHNQTLINMTKNREHGEYVIFWADKIAAKVIKRSRETYKTECGLGASGIPHVGSVGDGIRAYTVTLALKDRGVASDFIAFSDDRDGLRKVPIGFPESLEEYIGFPVSRIPDPFGCHGTYGAHMSSLLLDAFEKVGVTFTFQSGDQAYRDGLLDDMITEILDNWQKAGTIIYEVTGQKKYLEQLPFNVMCSNCGRIYTTRAYEWIRDKKRIFYVCDQEFIGADSKTGKELPISGCGHEGEASIRDGKLTWKVEFAARWKALDISFEAFGKDILDSVKANDRVAQEILGVEPPVHALYELFVERGGRKISKSTGNIFTPQVWLSYGSPESLRLMMLKRLATTRVVDLEEIPRYMDEVDALKKVYFGKEKVKNEKEKAHLTRLLEYVYFLCPPQRVGLTISYQTLVRIARMLPRDIENRYEIFKGILQRSGLIEEFSEDELDCRIEYATEWVEEVEELEKEGITLTEEEKKALKALSDNLTDREGEEIQQLLFKTANEHGLKPRRFFEVLYSLILGSDRGPRAGNLISALGADRVKKMISEVLCES